MGQNSEPQNSKVQRGFKVLNVGDVECCTVKMNCHVEISAYSAYGMCMETPSKTGIVTVGGATVWQGQWCGTLPNPRGVTILQIDPFSCTVEGKSQTFDTHISAAAAENLGKYLEQLEDGKVIVGVTGDDPSRRLRNALPALQQLEVDVGDIGYRSSFAFVAQKGYKEKTILDKVLTEGRSHRNPANLDAWIMGT